jgi:release factor glutamine methyltransferase
MTPPPPMLWRAVYAELCERLGSTIDARRIVERASGRDGGEFVAVLDEPVPARAVPFVEDMASRRLTGEPLQYVVGRWGFRGLDLLVDRRVLIPRPETEQVVEVALDEARRLGAGPLVAADLGTGSGAIALSLATELTGTEVWGVDVSADALAVARANLTGIGMFAATRVRLVEGSWFAGLPAELRGRLGLIVSNPPYLAADEDLPPEVSWEPPGALIAGPTGLEAVAEIVSDAPGWLARPGVLVMEIAPHQAERAERLALDAGFEEADVRPDLQGRLRSLVARIRGA